MADRDESDLTGDRKLSFEEFPSVSREQWEAVIKEDLGGKDYKKILRWNPPEGFSLLPFYVREDIDELPGIDSEPGVFPYKRGTSPENNDWTIQQDIYEKSAQKANEEALSALENGVDSLGFTFNIHKSGGMLGDDLEGTSIQSQQDFTTLLQDVDIESTALYFYSGAGSPAYLAMLSNLAEQRNSDKEAVHARFLYDPWSYTLSNGRHPQKPDRWVGTARIMARFANNHLKNVQTLGVNLLPFHHAGASVVQEIGSALAIGNEYLAWLTETGLTPQEIARQIHFCTAVGSDFYLEMAKLRALRSLWSRVAQQYLEGDPDSTPYIHSVTSMWDKTIYDEYNNLFRATANGMSAVIGGTHSLSILPYNAGFNLPDSFSERMARNTQLIMKQEAHMDKVVDPAGGSYFIEKLTDKLARQSWSFFQEIEKQGGMLKAIEGGFIQSAVERIRQKHEEAVTSGEKIIIGVNKYPNMEDKATEKVGTFYTASSLEQSDFSPDIQDKYLISSLATAFKEGALVGDVVDTLFRITKHNIRPLRSYRASQPFEDLRMATERHEKRSGHRPLVQIVPMGDPGIRNRRSTFAFNLFGCAGYDIEDPVGFDSTEEAVETIRTANPDIVAVCAPDHLLEGIVESLASTLDSMEPRPMLVVAGYPENQVKHLGETGVDEFIHKNRNFYETLQLFNKKLGIEQS